MIFPQFKQLGAVSNRGCIEALHGHFLLSVDSDGFVESSKAAMAAVRSATLEVVVEFPFCGVEAPECVCECEEWAGFFACFERTLANPKSDIRFPDAEGGSFCAFLAGEASREVAEDTPPVVVWGT